MADQAKKERIINELRKSISKLIDREIDDPDEAQLIIKTALARRRDNTISDYREIGTTASELLSFLHDALLDTESSS